MSAKVRSKKLRKGDKEVMDDGGGDSDGSLTWDDFFGREEREEELVGTLLRMYDALLEKKRPAREGNAGDELIAPLPPSLPPQEDLTSLIPPLQEISPVCTSLQNGHGESAPEGEEEEVVDPAGDDLPSYIDRVVMEIVETERVYVNDLRQIIQGYLDYWRLLDNDNNGNHQGQVDLSSVLQLFSNIEDIAKFNGAFLRQLEDAGGNAVGVARAFVASKEGFSIYAQYCTHYPRTMSLLTEMMSVEPTARAFRERQAALGHALPLGSFLLKPVQRVLKYHLLLHNIVNAWEGPEEDRTSIEAALDAMTGLAAEINEMKRKHEEAVRVQEVASLLYGWDGPDLTTYGALIAEGTFRAAGARALRHVFLFERLLLVTKRREEGALVYKAHIYCGNLMLIESVPGDPCAFHVLPFDSPRSQTTLIARSEDVKREWGRLLKRVILENYPSVIPSHAAQLLMSLGQTDHTSVSSSSPGGTSFSKAARRQHSAPEYLERRKGSVDSERRKSEKSSLKARLRKARKSSISDGVQRHRNSPEVSPPKATSTPLPETPANLESRLSVDRGIDRKLSSASCPPTVLPRQSSLVKKLAGWRRKSEPGGMYPNGKPGGEVSINPCLQEASSISSMSSSSVPDPTEVNCSSSSCSVFEEQEAPLNPPPFLQEERRESIEEIVGQLVMQKREFQRILSKQRLAHLRRAIQIQRRVAQPDAPEDMDTDEEEDDTLSPAPLRVPPPSASGAAIPSGEQEDSSLPSSQVQRTVSDPGQAKSKAVSSRVLREGGVRHTHSFNCPAAASSHKNEASPLAHGDSGVFTTSSSSSSSEASLLPTLPAVWVRTQRPHFPAPSPASSKSGSLPRSFQMGAGQQPPSPDALRPRPLTIASDKAEEEGNFDPEDHHSVLHPPHRIYRPTSRDLFSSPSAFLQPNTPSIKSLLNSVTARLKKNRHKKMRQFHGSSEGLDTTAESSLLSLTATPPPPGDASRIVGARLAAQSNVDLRIPSNGRPQSVLSVASSTATTSSSGFRDEDKMSSSGLGESLSGSSSHLESTASSSGVPGEGLYLRSRRNVDSSRRLRRDLYFSYIDGESRDRDSDSDASGDSFYERSFEAIESLLLDTSCSPGDRYLPPDSAIYSATEESADEESSSTSSTHPSPTDHSSSASSSTRNSFFSGNHQISSGVSSSISALAARLSNTHLRCPHPPSSSINSRRSRLIRSQGILEKLKVLEEHALREELLSTSSVNNKPLFEGIKSIGERRKELELWKEGRNKTRTEEEYETSSQHSTSTINTVIELSPTSRRASCSASSCSGGSGSPQERPSSPDSAVTQKPSHPQGWVKLLIGKIQSSSFEEQPSSSPLVE